MLTGVAAHRSGGPGDQQSALAALFHVGEQHRSQPEQAEGSQTPAHLKGLERGVAQGPVADLCAYVEYRHFYGPDVVFYVSDQGFYAALFSHVDQTAVG